MPGKEVALSSAHILLAMAPAPTGLTTLFGDYGRGKTGILKSLTAQFILAGVSARYCRAADLLGEIRSTYRDGSEISEEEIIALVGGIRFLAVDEVDRISATDWAMSTLMRILDTRYTRRALVATMIATNAQPDSMTAQWGYLQSRLRDGARIRVGGQDLRG
jgi:DNA replication protein DnaC